MRWHTGDGNDMHDSHIVPIISVRLFQSIEQGEERINRCDIFEATVSPIYTAFTIIRAFIRLFCCSYEAVGGADAS